MDQKNSADAWDDMEDDVFADVVADREPVDMAKASREWVRSAPIGGDEGREFKDPCKKCGGSGFVVIGYRYQRSVSCFGCSGKGFKIVKTDPAVLAVRRQAAAEGRVQKQLAAAAALKGKVGAWKAEHPAEAAWLSEKANSFEFAGSLNESLHKWGRLTEGQLAAVQRCVERDAQRAVERAAAVANAPEAVGVSKIEEAFAAAKAHIKWPKMRLAKFLFKPAGAASKNPGAIYVMDAEEKNEEGKPVYLGKVIGGRLQLMRNAQQHEEAVLSVIADPKAAAQAYGLEFGQCSICGRELTNKDSIEAGIGPICAQRFGW